jgi:Zn-dependent metalloprotease
VDSATALRSMKAPGTAYEDDVLGKDPQPGHMKDYVTTFEDNGGVHINSGIPNKAFYLCAMALGGHAWEKAGRIWYETLISDKVNMITRFSGFAAATKATAGKLYGGSSAEANAVSEAWKGVGVG